MTERKPIDTLLELLLIALFVFIGVRSVLLDFTHDEAYSFLNIKQFWYAQFLCNANSHWLNSGAMKISELLGGERVWQLRWFSVLCSGGILFFTYHWIKSLKTNSTKLFAFALACLNLFVLDYMVMARGYVSGLFFEVLSLALFFISQQRNKLPMAQVALWCAGLSAIANFNFFYFFLAFAALYNYTIYFSKGTAFFKNKGFYFDAIVVIGFVLLVLRALLFIKRCSNDFGLGADDFIPALFSSLIDGYSYKNIGIHNSSLNAVAMVLAALIFSSAIYGILQFRQHKKPLYFYASVIYCLVIAALVFNHYMFHVLYPYYRSALPLFPLTIINLIGFTEAVWKKTKLKTIVLGVVSLVLGLNFCRNVDLKYTFDFYHQVDAKPAFELVQKKGGKHVGMSHEHFGVYINYYQETDKFNYSFSGVQLNTYDDSKDWIEKDSLQNFDYLILYPPYELSYYKKRKIHFSGITLFPVSKTVVLKVN